MSNMMIRIQNDAVRLAADDGGLKSLRSADGRRQLVWTTLSEYSLQVQSGEGGVALDSRQAACAELPAEKGWARRFTHPLLDVDVVYTLTDAGRAESGNRHRPRPSDPVLCQGGGGVGQRARSAAAARGSPSLPGRTGSFPVPSRSRKTRRTATSSPCGKPLLPPWRRANPFPWPRWRSA